MKILALFAVVFLCSCDNEGAASHSEDLKREFQDVCANYQDPGFDERLAEIFPVGDDAAELQDLLSIADRKITDSATTIYVFDYATGAFSEQGLVVSVLVDMQGGRIQAVRSAVAAN